VSVPTPTPDSSPILDASVGRRLRHSRSFQFQAFERDDGLWDLEGELTDVKADDFHLASGTRPAGEAVHNMVAVLTVDQQLNVVSATARSNTVPYPGFCDTIGPAYGSLVGLNLLHNFRHEVKQRFSGVKGCTHMTDLIFLMPTVAVQAFSGHIKRETGAKPFALDRCHALKSDQGAVKHYYPSWYVLPLTSISSPIEPSRKTSSQ
jgi:Protein of unknown function (DUF2889)